MKTQLNTLTRPLSENPLTEPVYSKLAKPIIDDIEKPINDLTDKVNNLLTKVEFIFNIFKFYNLFDLIWIFFFSKQKGITILGLNFK